MFQLVATDLDGTLLKSDKTISQETKELLYRINEQGIWFVPSTGRTHAELPEIVRGLPFLRYAITCNGGGVYDYQKNCYIFNFTIEKNIAERVIEAIKKLPVYPTMVCEGARFIQADERGKVPEFVKKSAAAGIVEKATVSQDLVMSLHSSGREVQKFMLYPFGPERTEEVLKALQSEFPELFITTSGPLFVEVNAAGIDKGKTLKLLCEKLGIPIKKTIAFGDAANDIAMLKMAGYAVVPENGSDEVKAFADTICESCDEDGFRKELERQGM